MTPGTPRSSQKGKTHAENATDKLTLSFGAIGIYEQLFENLWTIYDRLWGPLNMLRCD